MCLFQGGLKLNGKWTNDELLLAVQGAVFCVVLKTAVVLYVALNECFFQL